KLICYYNDPCDQPGANGPMDPIEWEFFDLANDPFETTNLIGDPSRAGDVERLRAELERLQAEVGDHWP
ncbi:MAG: sulfatase, partial [Ilumatobacteraceae bacterium]